MIYDVKMYFTRKARCVKDGHRTPKPESSSYTGVVSRESIRIMLTHAALHDVPVVAADVQNAYLQAPLQRSTISFVDLSLAWNTLVRRLSSHELFMEGSVQAAVSYTHLTLPTKRIV